MTACVLRVGRGFEGAKRLRQPTFVGIKGLSRSEAAPQSDLTEDGVGRMVPCRQRRRRAGGPGARCPVLAWSAPLFCRSSMSVSSGWGWMEVLPLCCARPRVQPVCWRALVETAARFPIFAVRILLQLLLAGHLRAAAEGRLRRRSSAQMPAIPLLFPFSAHLPAPRKPSSSAEQGRALVFDCGHPPVVAFLPAYVTSDLRTSSRKPC